MVGSEAIAVAGKEHVRNLDFQMSSDEALVYFKYHKSSYKSMNNDSISYLTIYSLEPACKRPPQLFQGHPSTGVYVTCLRKHS